MFNVNELKELIDRRKFKPLVDRQESFIEPVDTGEFESIPKPYPSGLNRAGWGGLL